MELVDGRECGECNVCCVTLHIDTSEFKKLPGVRCPHLSLERRCSIYAERYSVCRTYHCGWRYLAFLSDNWRPDRSGVLVAFTPAGELPKGYAKGMSFILIAPPPKSLNRALYHYVANLIADDVYVTLAITGPPGHYPAVAVLNHELRKPGRTCDPAAVETIFNDALAWTSREPHRFAKVPETSAPSGPA